MGMRSAAKQQNHVFVTRLGAAAAAVSHVAVAVAVSCVAVAVSCVAVGVAVSCVTVGVAVSHVAAGVAVSCVAVSCVVIGVAVSCVAVGVAVGIASGVDGVNTAAGRRPVAMSFTCVAHPRGGCFWALGVTPAAGSSGLLEKPRAAREGLPLLVGAAGRPGTPCRSRCARLQLAPAPGLSSLPFCAGPFDLGTRPLYVAPGLARPPRPTQGWGFPFHLARGAPGSERESRRDLVVSQNLGDSAFSGHCGLAALIF